MMEPFVALGMLALLLGAGGAQEAAPARPSVWMMPPGAADGRCLRELFEHPEQWAQTRRQVDVLGYADHVLNRQFKDEELRAWLPQLQTWGLTLGLEVGAIKEWGPTGKRCFEAERPMWDRFQRLGGKLGAIAMDEPLVCSRDQLKQSFDYAVEETAQFIAQVRAHFPDVRVGDIEPFPSLSLAELTRWIDALQARLAQLGVRGLDFFRVDVDWVHFVVSQKSGWGQVRQLELACRQRKLPFSLIYWAANYPHLQRKGLADDAAWYVGVMRQADDYALVGGQPDELVVESWVGAPSRSLPETGDWTFTRSVLDFCRRFAPRQN